MVVTSKVHSEKKIENLIKLAPGVQAHALLVGRQIVDLFVPEIAAIVAQYAAENLAPLVSTNSDIPTFDTKKNKIWRFINAFSANFPQRNVDVIFKTRTHTNGINIDN